MARDRLRQAHADLRSNGLGEDPGIVPLGDRPSRPRAGPARLRSADRVRVAPQGPLLRHRAKPAGPAAGDRGTDLGRAADGRHAADRAAEDAPRAAGHPDHHARVAVSDDQLGGPRDPRRSRGGDRRRDPRRGAVQARIPPGADLGATRPPRRPACPANRPLRDPAAAGADRRLPGRHGPRVRDRRRLGAQAARPGDRRPGRGHGRAQPALQQAARRSRDRQDPTSIRRVTLTRALALKAFA